MEENNVETLEEIIPDMDNDGKEAPLKEYEKLLLAERDRLLHEKALNLVKFGCFEQKQQGEFDSANYAIISGKKYRGLYDLFQDNETSALVFVCPLVENNKGDTNEKIDLEPYAYDCIYLENMDDETYQQVCKAFEKNINNYEPKSHLAIKICYFIFTAIALFMFAYQCVTQIIAGYDFFTAVSVASLYFGTLISGAVICAPLIFLMDLKYKENKNKK